MRGAKGTPPACRWLIGVAIIWAAVQTSIGAYVVLVGLGVI